MRITSEADYAVRMVYLLASRGEKTDAKTIGESIDVTQNFCLKILRKLVHADIIRSYKGAGGGYSLAKSAHEISVRDVVCAIDGPILLNKCLDEADTCAHMESCGCVFRELWADVSREVDRSLSRVTFKEAAKLKK